MDNSKIEMSDNQKELMEEDERVQKEQHIQELYKVLSYSNEQFDKHVLFIASGALAISFAFIEKLVPDLQKAVSKSCLISSWYLFGYVIFMSLLSHFISSYSIRWSIEHYGEEIATKKGKQFNFVIRALNVIMIIVLLIATILLINFIKQNI